MNYPNHIVKMGETNAVIINAVRDKLAACGYPSPAGGIGFDAKLKSLVRLFQSQNVDVYGNPLKIDGEIGPMTWGALFGAEASTGVAASIGAAALAVAIGEIGVMEVPPGSNRGPRVEQYLASTNLGGGYFWCMAFVYWCFREASLQSGLANPFPRTAGCLDAWNKVQRATPANLITKAAAQENPGLVRPGAVFIQNLGNGMGHTGFVRENKGGALVTVEGNSNNSGGNNGVGVFELQRRSVMTPNLRGFISFL